MKSINFLHNLGILSAKVSLKLEEVLAKMQKGCIFHMMGQERTREGKSLLLLLVLLLLLLLST